MNHVSPLHSVRCVAAAFSAGSLVICNSFMNGGVTEKKEQNIYFFSFLSAQHWQINKGKSECMICLKSAESLSTSFRLLATLPVLRFAFPTLFPYGNADLRQGRPLVPVKPREYFKHLVKYKDQRFALHPVFSYFCANSLMRWKALQNGAICMRKCPQFRGVRTVEALREVVRANPNIDFQAMVSLEVLIHYDRF